MPVQKKHTTRTSSKGKKKPLSRTTHTARKRKTKKPKVVLSAGKVYLLSGIIIAVCAVSLLFSILATPSDDTAFEKKGAQKTESLAKSPVESKEKAEKKTIPQVSPIQQPISQKTEDAQKKTVAPSSEKKTALQSAQPLQQAQAKKSQSAEAARTKERQQRQAQTQKSEVNSAPLQKPDPSKALAAAKPDKPEISPTEHKTEKSQPKSPFTIPSAKNGATLVFVIDDAGLHPEYVRRYTALPFPLAIAVLPHLSCSKECAQVVRAGYKELMLHQPMQAHAYPNGKTPDPGKGAILPDMSTAQVAETIKQNLDQIGPDVKGFNNHEGSLITENAIKMGAALEVAAERGIYFLDSRTTSHSAVPQAALERDMRYIARFAPFLDNKIDRESMLQELYRGLEVANKNGYAVIIGHVDKSVHILPQLLADIYPYLVQAGYTFATPSSLR